MPDKFPLVTAASPPAQTLSFYTPARDMTDYLPALAADRLKMLRQRIQDKNLLIPAFETRREASEEKIASEARLQRLIGHRSTGGFELADDDMRVVAERKTLAKLTAEARRLNDLNEARSTQWREAGYVLANIEAWLRDGVPSGTKLDICETAVPVLPKGQTLTDAIQIRERRIRELQADARRVEASPFPAAYARKRMREQVAALAERGRPDISPMIEHDLDIDFVQASHFVPVIGKTEANFAGWQQADAFLLTCFLNRDALIAALDAEILAASDDVQGAMTHEQRQQATATIMADMLACDRELSELIWAAQAENLPHEFRADASPLAVLGLQLVTAAPSSPSPGTTGGHAFDRVGLSWR